MADSLAESFEADLRCDPRMAVRLAVLARARVPGIAGAAEDSDEDLVVRLRDPRTFGEFVAPLLEDRAIPEGLRTVLAERVFDLLPLPRGEADVILVEARAPRQLMAIARYLSEAGGFTVLHMMHLLFAVFLDRSIVEATDRPIRSAVLQAVVELSEASAALRALYAAMHLAAVSPMEAHREFRTILRMNGDPAVKACLARAATAGDGGLALFLGIARDEGLVSPDWRDASAPEAIANIPRLPPRLSALGQRWLARAL